MPALLLMLTVVLVSGCGSDPELPDPSAESPRDARGGWTRIDLSKRPRTSKDADPDRIERDMLRLGHGIEVWTRDNEPNLEEREGKRLAGEVPALVAPADETLGWRLPLGDEPFLSFIPLSRARGAEADCRLTHHVLVAPAGETPNEIHSVTAEDGRFAPAAVELALDTWAGQQIDLLLRVDAESCDDPRAAWGSPAVYSRRAQSRAREGRRPNVLLIGLDTVRADVLGVYGREPSPTPAIDRLAAQSDVFLDAYSTFNVTNPSFASILTGLYGKNHGVYGLRTPMADGHRTLSELFAEAGYDTAAILSARHLGHRQSGLNQGFGLYRLPPGQSAAETAVDNAMNWLSVPRERPFFLWLHLFDPHTPHTPPRPYSEGYRPATTGLGPVREWLPFRDGGEVAYEQEYLGGHAALYASEVAYLDRHVGRLLDFLGSHDLTANTVIALVSDHGENLGEHGVFFRHSGLWDTTLKVPLMIRWPGRERQGRRLAGLVQTLDLFPTLLGAAGLDAPPSNGLDLRGEERRWEVFAEAVDRHGAMVRTADHLLFWSFEDRSAVGTGRFFYDLTVDPAQEKNLAGTGSVIEEELHGRLRGWLAERRFEGLPASVPLSEDEIRQLRTLGYVDP